MWHTTRVLSVLLTSTLLACAGDGTDLIGGPPADAGESASVDAASADAASPDAGSQLVPGEVFCGDDRCPLPEEECCVDADEGGADECVATDTCPQLSFRCDQREDCGSDYCCLVIGGGDLGMRCTPADTCENAICQEHEDCPPSAATCCEGLCKPAC